MADMMTFPETVEEFMEQYKVTDTEHIYSNGMELVPIFRMKQWFAHKPERVRGKWKKTYLDHEAFGERPSIFYCSVCNQCIAYPVNYCPNCGAKMEEGTA